MKFTIGKFNRKTGRVSVVFLHAGIAHKREVNACLDARGKYDAAATDARIAEVASGVQHKIEAGLFGQPTLSAQTEEHGND